MLFALIPSLVTATSLSSYSMNIVNTVYGSIIPQQDEEIIPQQDEEIIPQQDEGIFLSKVKELRSSAR